MKPSVAKLVAFSLTVVFIILLVLELALRVFGFGGLPRFFVPYLQQLNGSGGKLVRYSTDALWPYFGRRLVAGGRSRLVGSNVPERVLVPKPQQMYRVVMVGESSVQGFPYPQNLCAASFLENHLQSAITDGRKVEVINTGITAVASFPLRRVVEEACELEPDLIVIYAGHNEYYGAFGVASAQSAGTSVAAMKLELAWRSTGIFGALLALSDRIAAAGAKGQPNDVGSSVTLMEMMGTGRLIREGDRLRSAAEKSLIANVDAMIDSAQKKEIPVVLCSLAANERDLLPVRSAEPADAATREKWSAVYHRALDAVSSGPTVSQPRWQEAAKLAPDNAAGHFYLARTYDLQGQTTPALEEYRKARDTDAMPWRATTEFNRAIRELAERRKVTFADVDEAFHEDAAGNGEAAPGWRLFGDHLHPSLEGQALLARAVFEAIRRDKLLPLKGDALPDWMQVAASLRENRLVDYRAAHLMASLFQRPPLNDDAAAFRHTNGERQKLLRAMAAFETRAADRFVTLSMEGRQPWSISFLGGEEALRAHNFGAASEYFDSATREAVAFSPERCYASYYSLYTHAEAVGRLTTDTLLKARTRLSEAEYVEKAEEQPPVRQMLLHAMTGLALLTDDPRGAQRWATEIPDQSPHVSAIKSEVRQIEQLRQARVKPVGQGRTIAPPDAQQMREIRMPVQTIKLTTAPK